ALPRAGHRLRSPSTENNVRRVVPFTSAVDAHPVGTMTARLPCAGLFLMADSPCPAVSSLLASTDGKLGTTDVQPHQRTFLVFHIRVCHVGNLASPCQRLTGRAFSCASSPAASWRNSTQTNVTSCSAPPGSPTSMADRMRGG